MYKKTGELKREVKDSLRGRWTEALLLNLVPSLLQIISFFLVALVTIAVIAFALIFLVSNDSSFDGNAISNSSTFAAMNTSTSSSFISPIISLLLSFLTIGISFTFLDVIRKQKEQKMEFKDAFRLFNGVDFVPVFLINLFMYVFTTLWTLLFFIPGIIKGYSYSQSNFIYKDLSSHKDVNGMGATSFITESRNLMDGHKRRLFLLDLSFIGWYIVGILTLGIGLLWINPYINATKAAFYNDLAKDRYLMPDVEEVIETEEEWTSF